MRKQSLVAVVGLMAFLQPACDYTNNDVFMVDPISGPEPVISVQCNLESDSVYPVLDSLQVIYQVTLEHADLYYVEASINEVIVYGMQPEYDSDTVEGLLVMADSFFVHSDLNLVPGNHNLDLYFFHSTNTNSLADLAGTEYTYYQQEYRIKLEGTEP